MKLDKVYRVSDLPQSEEDFGLVPPGTYNAQVVTCDVKTTKAGNGQYLKFSFRILGPSYAGRFIFSNINIVNPNTVAQEIGFKQLCNLIESVGLKALEDTDELIGRTCLINVAIKSQPDSQYQDSNIIKKFLPTSSSKNSNQYAAKSVTKAHEDGYDDDVAPF